MSDGENILSRVPKNLLTRALKKLPAADMWQADTAETTIDVPGLGAVRVTARRTEGKPGKASQYFWTPEKATAVGRDS